MKWIDEDPSRYAAISDGDRVCLSLEDGTVHFIEAIGEREGLIPYGRIWVTEHTVCGRRVREPEEWYLPDTPIAGVVNCEACLHALAEAVPA